MGWAVLRVRGGVALRAPGLKLGLQGLGFMASGFRL